jgi:hypothetical protein
MPAALFYVQMSALGHERTHAVQKGMSALRPIATAKTDFANGDVCFAL